MPPIPACARPCLHNPTVSGTDAFTITEVLDCYVALDSVLEERKRLMDERGARDDGLIERGDWVGLRRAMEASKVREGTMTLFGELLEKRFLKGTVWEAREGRVAEYGILREKIANMR